ncbi:hypothetical protein SDC9_194831 [bioreactor metagenome]|uniref:Uncharacterized protein n=1 Tax=bioreactor metagenome TaxID=1076179 RepID=A0A645I7W8_9ZZZZ
MKRAFLIFVISLLLIGCRGKDDRLVENIMKTIDSKSDKNGSCTINMMDITDFEWDQLMIYQHNNMDSTGIIGELIFMRGNKVVLK